MPKAIVRREVALVPKEQALAGKSDFCLAVVVRRLVEQIDETAAAVAEMRGWLAQEYERRAIEKEAAERFWEFMATLERPAKPKRRTKSREQVERERLELALAQEQLREAYRRQVEP